MMLMPNKLPKFFDNHKICIICEGNEEYEYLNRLKNLKVWNEQYDISLVNAGGNGNIPARYQDRYQNGADELVLVRQEILIHIRMRLNQVQMRLESFGQLGEDLFMSRCLLNKMQ